MNVEPDCREAQNCANTDSKAATKQTKNAHKKEQKKELQKLREKEWKRRTKGKK